MKQRSANHKENHHHHTEGGNVLWFILIVVVLLGALTMALSRSATNVDQSGDVEQQRISASQMMRYAKGLENAVQQLILNGCSENEISFENTTVLDYENTVNTDNEGCFVFSAKGAGQTWQSFSEADIFGGVDTTIQNNYRVLGMGEDDADTGSNDMVFFAKTTQDICTAINRELGIPTDYANLQFKFDEYVDPYLGSFVTTSREIGGNGSEPLLGQPSGCGQDAIENYIFYHVLLAR